MTYYIIIITKKKRRTPKKKKKYDIKISIYVRGQRGNRDKGSATTG